MLSATTWVPRGFPAEYPIKYELDEEEMSRISEMAKLQLEEAQEDLDQAKDVEKKVNKMKEDSDDEDNIDNDDELKEYDMEHYDDTDEEDDETPGGKGLAMFGNLKSVAYHEPGEKDPYITVDPEEDEEKEELRVLPTDNMVLAAKTEDDVSFMEVYVYDDSPETEEAGPKNDLYVHHDFMLPSFPLCVEWLDYRVGKAREEGNPDQPGNFCAIGTFEPEIEVWNLDVVDSAFPDLILGQRPENADTGADTVKMSKKKKKKALSKKLNDEYHIDAVLSLSANRSHRNLLVSGSADTTVKLWDLNNGSCAKSFQFHDGKVSSVNWNPRESTVLLSGGYDAHAIVSDLRTEDKEGQRKWKVDGDIEGVKWSPNGQDFYVSTENGRVYKFDARKPGSSVWTLQAHDSEVSCFDINPFIEDYMVTASTDRIVKLWNLSAESSKNAPSMILSRDLDIGKVFSVGFAPDREVFGHIVAAGSGGDVKVWDTMSNRVVREAMGKKKLQEFASKENADEKIVGLPEEEEEESDDEEVDQDQSEEEDSDEEV
jgi:periodic tryptophan protein 1